jgi:hypothetical protein
MTRSNLSNNQGMAPMAWRNIDIDHSLIAELPTRGHVVPDEHDPPPPPGAKRTHAATNGREPLARTDASREPKRDAAREPARPSKGSSIPEKIVRLAAQHVVDLLREIDREARHAGRTVPTGEERDAVATCF